jgi:predicted nucleic acid-binding protein
MMARTQISLEAEMQRRARQRASELGISLAEYLRRLVARDLMRPKIASEVDRIFDLGAWRDQDFSIVDRTSFAVMRRLGIERVASLDEDFAVFRFGPRRRQSFGVVR